MPRRAETPHKPAKRAPRDFEVLKAALVERRSALPKRLNDVADYMVAHSDDIAFGTVASVAADAQVPPSTLVRFSQALGYAGFSELQNVFRLRLRERWPDYRKRVASLPVRGQDGDSAYGLLDGFADSAMASLQSLRETIRAEDLQRATAILAGADTVFLLGMRRAFPVTAYLAYAMGKLGLRASLVDNVATLAGEQVAGMRRGDAMIAVSFTPYTPTTIEHANACAKRGIPVVAITDSPFSPLAPAAAVNFEVVEADFGSFRSLAASLSLAMALAVGTAARRKS